MKVEIRKDKGFMFKDRLCKSTFHLKRDWQLYLLILIPVTYFIIFKYLPMYGLAIAFQDYDVFSGVTGSKWVGLDVFKKIFSMNDFYKVLKNTLMLNVLDLMFNFPAPIILAMLLNELKNGAFKKITQTMLYFPHFISWVIIGGIVTQLFATNTGLVNIILFSMGFDKIPFLTDKNNWLAVYLFSGIWQSAGWNTIIYLAAITSVSPELYESADIDGANRFRKMISITLPSIVSTIVVLLILNVGRMLSISFERPFVLGNPTVYDYSDVISTFVYRLGIQSGEYAMTAAVGLFQSLAGVVLLLLTNFIANRFGEEGVL